MRAITIAKPHQLEQIDIEHPGSPAPGQVLVRTHCMGICGTDVSSYLGKFPFFDYPRIPGHELGVEVVAVGDGVDRVKPSDRCSVEPYLNCGECYPCRRGLSNCCEKLQVIGVMCDGGLCEEFLIPAEKLHPSASLSYEQLALVETLAIGCHGTARVAPQAGDHVLIIGAGPIGMAMLEFTRLAGAEITVMDRVESRLEFCRETYGIDHTILSVDPESDLQRVHQITGGDRYAIVADATGNQHSMSGALSYVAHSGQLLYLGVTTETIAYPHPQMHRPEMTIKGSRNALPADFTRIIGLIEDGQIDTNPWITHRTSFDQVVEEFETFTRPETGVIKAVIDVGG